MKHWIAAFRLRTLPLAFSSILMGSVLAAFYGAHRWSVSVLCILTTLFLQILSNLANDYGDYEHGADNAERIGPTRAMQSGAITREQMKKAIALFAVLAFISGISLIYTAFGHDHWWLQLLFLGIGLGAIWAAFNYTAGKNPYGYRAMGDLFVFLFFGLVAVGGTFYLHSGTWNWWVLLPASASGLMGVGVLNINNTRDLVSDKNAGKITLPVLMGARAARYYQLFIMDAIGVLLAIFILVAQESTQLQDFSFLLAYVLLFRIAHDVMKKPAEELDPYLKQMVLASLLITLLFAWSLLY